MITLGIDIGGTGIKGALVDTDTGAMVTDRKRLLTPEQAIPQDVAKVVKELVESFDYKGVIGCGFPAIVRHGVAYSAANIHKTWIGLNVNQLLTEASGCNTFVLNDADAAGMAEMAFGVGKSMQNGVVIVLTLGTGIGSAIFTDGKLVPNTEFGHLLIRGKDAEMRASDAARRKKEMTWKKYAERLQEYLMEMERLFSPDLFVIGGGLSKNFDKYVPLIKINTKIVPAQLLNQAGIIGAAIYAAEKGS